MCGWTVHLEEMINLDVTQRLLWVPVDAYHQCWVKYSKTGI